MSSTNNSSNRMVVPEAKEAMDKFKMEVDVYKRQVMERKAAAPAWTSFLYISLLTGLFTRTIFPFAWERLISSPFSAYRNGASIPSAGVLPQRPYPATVYVFSKGSVTVNSALDVYKRQPYRCSR